MADGNFLPEDDQDFLQAKEIKYKLLTEEQGEETRRAIEFLDFPLPANLYQKIGAGWTAGGTVSVMVLIPKGYARARLDSWYVSPGVFLENGVAVNCASGEATMFDRSWQFWSRHLTDDEWRDGIDGLETYLQYIRAGLRDA